MFYTGIWVFLSFAVDNALNTQYGYYRGYYGGTEYEKFATYSPWAGNLFSISPTTRVYWGGDSTNKICYCDTRYIRFYIDYAAHSQAEALNFALMNPESTFSHCYQDLSFFLN